MQQQTLRDENAAATIRAPMKENLLMSSKKKAFGDVKNTMLMNTPNLKSNIPRGSEIKKPLKASCDFRNLQDFNRPSTNVLQGRKTVYDLSKIDYSDSFPHTCCSTNNRFDFVANFWGSKKFEIFEDEKVAEKQIPMQEINQKTDDDKEDHLDPPPADISFGDLEF